MFELIDDLTIPQEEPKQDLEKEMFELEQELDIPSHLRWHNSKSKQETTLEEAAKNYANIPLHKDIDTEERYFNSNVRDYDSFIAGAKSNAAKDYWYSQFQEQDKKFYSEEDFKNCYFSAIKSTGEGWNGEYAKGNSPCIEEMFGESFQDWYLQFKKQNNEQ